MIEFDAPNDIDVVVTHVTLSNGKMKTYFDEPKSKMFLPFKEDFGFEYLVFGWIKYESKNDIIAFFERNQNE